MAPDPKSEPAAQATPGASSRVGQHTLYVEQGIVHCRFAGDVSRDDIAAILEFGAQVQKRDGYIFSLSDVRGIGHVGPEARRYVAQWMKGHRFDGSAIYGANLVTRTLVMLLLRAINLLRPVPFDSLFCATEQEGRAWIDEQRRKLRPGTL